MNLLQKIIEAIYAFLGGRREPRSDQADELDRKAAASPERLDWRNSIVDLMKLTGQDSSLAHRIALAKELGYPGEANGSSAMNVWLHTKVMERLS